MTGPEHFLKAEEHLELARNADVGGNGERYNLEAAQVHATLALAAATALARLGEMPVWDADAWQDIAGTQPEGAGGSR